jgi:Fic family protein
LYRILFLQEKNMKKNFAVLVLCIMTAVLPIASAFAQNSRNQYAAAISGTWKHEKEGLTFRFNTDGTFTMSEEGEEAERAARSEQRSSGEAVTTSVSGTYTVTDRVINMSMRVDGKNYPIRMAYRKINDDTLQLDRQNYRRVVE